MQRYSKKRQAILDCLCSTTTHPTAEWIYEQLRPLYPDLSFATVYRNLHQMQEDGLVRSVGIVDGHERFDGNTQPHSHVVCSRCGCVADMHSVTLPPELIAAAEAATGFSIPDASVRLVGLCAACSGR